jgi:hypothetical protein
MSKLHILVTNYIENLRSSIDHYLFGCVPKFREEIIGYSKSSPDQESDVISLLLMA